ncbi:MAG: NHLP bacteriocin system secretion protein [Myxacorys californica WJT36-NPBG1]|jgi:HlyD family secretion protein|nr:NHLP bacteriocin system secretion protein [Myxacorys californica WJT36-NPBG1]
MVERNNLFRKTSLERLRSPERLDQAVQIVNLKDWLPLSVLGLIIFLGLLWSIVGRISITVAGNGVLINPRRAIQLQSSIAGQLKLLNVQNGQCVEKGQVLATIEASALQQQLQQQRDKLTQLQQQAFQYGTLRDQSSRLEQTAILAQRDRLQQQLQDAQGLAPRFQTQGLAAISEQRASLQQQLDNAQALAPILQERLQSRQALANTGAIAQDTLLQTEQEYRQALQETIKLKAQLKQLNFQAVETQQRFLNNQSSIAQIQNQLDELNMQQKQLEQTNLADSQAREKETQEIQRSVIQLEKQVTDQSQIKSSQAGCITELTAAVGQVLSPGTRLGTLQATEKTGETVSSKVRGAPLESGIVYFAAKDGKKIQPNMKILITPDTVKREQFGSIVGTVAAVSALPVTREGAATVVGNSEVANQILGQDGGQIEVIAHLNYDASTSSGYQWSSSRGPDSKVTPGTLLSARVTVEERAPITFLLPFLKAWSGVH